MPTAPENAVDLPGIPTTSHPPTSAGPVLAGLGQEIYVAIRSDTSLGTGASWDPFDVSTEGRFQSALNSAQAGSVIHVATGHYQQYALTIDKSLTITGPRSALFTQATGAGKPIFTINGATVDFTLEGVSLSHGTQYREEANVIGIKAGASGFHNALFRNIYTSDFNNTFSADSVPVNQVTFEGCEFVYTYGRAGISNVAPYDHPCASIVGNSIQTLIVRGCTFNGLLDPTFTGVSGAAPTSQKVAADNFVQTGNETVLSIVGNTVLNHGIEGIDVARTDPTGIYAYDISGNHTVGATVPGIPGYNPGIATGKCQANITGNTISNASHGVSIQFSTYDEANNIVAVNGNTITRVLTGIRAFGPSSKSTYSNNFIWATSEPVKTYSGHSVAYTELRGIDAPRGNAANNIIISDEPAWDASTTLSSRSGNLFTLASVSGITPNHGVLISYAGGVVSFYPVQGISGNVVTVDNAYATAQPGATSGPIYYAYLSPTFTGVGGIVVTTGGNIYADNNVIVGFQFDLNQQNSGTITTSKHTTRSCHYVQPENATFIHLDPTFSDVPRLSASNTFTGLQQAIQADTGLAELGAKVATEGSALLSLLAAGSGDAILAFKGTTGLRIGTATGLAAASFTERFRFRASNDFAFLLTCADSAAGNNTLFVGSDHTNKLCFKDSGGTVHVLY